LQEPKRSEAVIVNANAYLHLQAAAFRRWFQKIMIEIARSWYVVPKILTTTISTITNLLFFFEFVVF
jgi:hypothetical protein